MATESSGGTSSSTEAGGNSASGGATLDTEPPVIVALSPRANANGVHADAHIVVTFSEPMQTESVESAYESNALPSSDVTMAWNDAGTELSIVPDSPLAYANVDDLSEPALEYSFEFSSSATDLAGNALSGTRAFEFSTLRRISFALDAETSNNLSGSWRSNDSSGVGNCAPSAKVVCAGDSVATNDVQYFGFATFDLSALPPVAELEAARLSAEIYQIVGDPFSLGALRVEQVAFEAIGVSAMQSDALAVFGVLAEDGRPGDLLSLQASEAARATLAQGQLAQFRFRFEEASDGDRAPDAVVLSRDSLSLDLVVLTP